MDQSRMENLKTNLSLFENNILKLFDLNMKKEIETCDQEMRQL